MNDTDQQSCPFWIRLLAEAEEWKGGSLQVAGSDFSRARFPNVYPITTKVTAIKFEALKDGSGFFSVEGEDFSCGFNNHQGDITKGEEGWITFKSAGGWRWRIKKPEKKEETGRLKPEVER